MKHKLEVLRKKLAQKRANIIKKLERPVAVLKALFGYGIMASLFVGGATVLGFLAALVAGGEVAACICDFIKAYVIPAVTYTSTITVLLGLVVMYMSGQSALTTKKNKKTQG